jgi:predicted enzyme related to lactoylglutathione lyase
MIQDIAFSYYCVEDMSRAVQFYEKTLGLTVLFTGEEWSEFSIQERRIALYKSTKPVPIHGGAVISLLAKPIEKVIDRLKSEGVHFVKEIQTLPYGKLAEFLDSEGNVLGLYEPPPKN